MLFYHFTDFVPLQKLVDGLSMLEASRIDISIDGLSFCSYSFGSIQRGQVMVDGLMNNQRARSNHIGYFYVMCLSLLFSVVNFCLFDELVEWTSVADVSWLVYGNMLIFNREV